jgi:hypothetical protein
LAVVVCANAEERNTDAVKTGSNVRMDIGLDPLLVGNAAIRGRLPDRYKNVAACRITETPAESAVIVP